MSVRESAPRASARSAWSSICLVALALAAQLAAGGAAAQPGGAAGAAAHARAAHGAIVPERFTAVTADMTPRDLPLRIDVREWSDAEARAAVVAALQSDDAVKSLAALPTIGYVWPLGSGVGYALKYA